MTVADKVRTALARELKRDPAALTPEQALREDLGLNSLDAIELMFKVEEEFDLEIPDADLQQLRTVGDLIAYLEGRLRGEPALAAPVVPAPPVSAPSPPAGAAKPAPPAPAAKRRTVPTRTGNKRPAKRPRA